MDVARLSGPPEPWHLGFLLGPRINAGGRIGRADLGVRLLLEEDPSEAARIAGELDRLNHERRAIEQATLEQAHAEAMAALGLEEKGAVVVTAQQGWHRRRGRAGGGAAEGALRAAGLRHCPGAGRHRHRLGPLDRRRRSRPRGARGGARGAAGQGWRPCHGGRRHAAQSALAPFRAFMEDNLAAAVEAARRESALKIDGAVSAGGFNLSLAELLARAGPYGAGNPEPVLALPAHTIAYADPVGESHVRLRLKSGEGKFVNAIAFRVMGTPLGKALLDNRGRAVHAAGSDRRRPLAGRGAGAAQARRYRGGLRGRLRYCPPNRKREGCLAKIGHRAVDIVDGAVGVGADDVDLLGGRVRQLVDAGGDAFRALVEIVGQLVGRIPSCPCWSRSGRWRWTSCCRCGRRCCRSCRCCAPARR